MLGFLCWTKLWVHWVVFFYLFFNVLWLCHRKSWSEEREENKKIPEDWQGPDWSDKDRVDRIWRGSRLTSWTERFRETGVTRLIGCRKFFRFGLCDFISFSNWCFYFGSYLCYNTKARTLDYIKSVSLNPKEDKKLLSLCFEVRKS